MLHHYAGVNVNPFCIMSSQMLYTGIRYLLSALEILIKYFIKGILKSF
ncbi:unnamed protein product [Gulo gulo]|uniref:Uncharacterized protein n=1 Tax=Gulo gulo TaxID=48420 RepID=A0A9X9PZS0_GULGU|nr:unnamed protein product [Gulo gulo]